MDYSCANDEKDGLDRNRCQSDLIQFSMAASFQRPTPASSMRHTGTSSSQLPPSAPVLEFRCMFTHDMFKKQKKWHDGSVKYHTFNKKVMVYDESRNLVGGLHYQQPEEFGEGLEIKLDRPILVQVEDQLGESTTDLTPLISRSGNSNASGNNNQPPRSVISRTQGLNSQIKPKSIKELLASSQGVIGRSRLPLQSPYEQRHALNEIQINAKPVEFQEPPAKKRKLVATEADSRPTIINKPAVHQSAPMNSTQIGSAKTREKPEVVREVMNISSDEEPMVSRVEAQPAKSKQRSPQKVKKLNAKKAKADLQPQDLSPVQSFMRDSVRQCKTQPLGHPTHPPARPASAPSAGRSFSFQASNFGPRSSLKFPSQKPRPKLIYKALLMGTPGFSENTGHDSTENSGSGSIRQPQIPARQVQNDLLELDALFESQSRSTTTQVEDGDSSTSSDNPQASKRASPIPDEDVQMDNHRDMQEDESLSNHSPLFVSQHDHPLSQGPNVYDDDDDGPDSFLDSIQNVPDSPLNDRASVDTDDEPEDDEIAYEKKDSPIPPHQSSPVPPLVENPASPSKLTTPHHTGTGRIDKTLRVATLSSPVESHLISWRRSANTFRRVFSETTAVDRAAAHHDEDGFSSDGVADIDNSIMKSLSKQSFLGHTGSSPTSAKNVAEQSGSPNARLQTDGLPTMSEMDRDVTQEPDADPHTETSTVKTGPWTMNESFLLFDWWPRGKQKPDYGQYSDASMNLRSNDNHEDVSTIISSRGMARKYGTFGSAKFVSQR